MADQFNSDDPQADAAGSGFKQIGSALGDYAKQQYEEGGERIHQAVQPWPQNRAALDQLAEQSAMSTIGDAGAKKPNVLEIEHYSSKPNLTVLDPNKMGTGVDAVKRGGSSSVPYSYSYVKGTTPETMMPSEKYYAQIDLDKHPIYDVSNDPKGIVAKVLADNDHTIDMGKISQAVKDQGYAGFTVPKHPDEALSKSVMMFKPVALTKSLPNGSSSLRQMAKDYTESQGLPAPESAPAMAPVSPERGARIAQEYENMEHSPDSPEVKQSYKALIDETLGQFKDLKKSGLQIDKIKEGQGNPYPNGSKDLFKDVNENNHIWYYPTEQGFGSNTKISDHPMLQETSEKINGEPLLANDVFRIVHDIYGHVKEGHTFGPKGEENAWLTHRQMYSPEARPAMTTETRGQNSWVNYGPYGEANRANPAKTVYADQKAGLLPDWVSNEGTKDADVISKRKSSYASGGEVQNYDDGGGVAASDGGTNVMSPTGELVSIPNDQLQAALHPVNGYRLATPEDVSSYQKEQKYGTPGQIAQTVGEGALSSATFGLVPGIGSAQDIRGRQEENPIASIAGGIVPFAAEQFIPGAGPLAAATAVPRAITRAGELAKEATGLTGVGAKALQYAAESAIMQGSNEVSKALLNDPDSSVSHAVANEGMAALLGGALGAASGGIGKTAELWESKFGAKPTDAIIDKTLPDIATQELSSGVTIPPVLHDAMSGDQDAYNRVQVLQKSDTMAGRNLQKDVASIYDQAQEKTLEALGADSKSIEKAPNAYEAGEALKQSLSQGIEEDKKTYGPVYDELRQQYKNVKVNGDQKSDLAARITKAVSEAGIGGLRGSIEQSTIKNIFESLDSINDADGIKMLNTGINNAARNPELQRLAAVVSPVIKDFESGVVQSHLASAASGGEEAAASLLARRKEADQAFKRAMGTMNELKQSLGLGRFKGTNGFLRALDEKPPEQILQRLSNKNRQDMITLLQEKFPQAAEIIKNYHINDMLHDSVMQGGELNTKKFLNRLLDGSINPEHMQQMITGSPVVKARLESIKNILNALPKDGNPSNSAAMIDKLWSGKMGTLMGGVFGVGGHGHVGGGLLGGAAESVIREIKPFLSYKILEMRASGKNIVPGNVKALYDYARSVAEGHSLVTKAVNSIFNANRVLPPSREPKEADRKKLDRYVAQVSSDPSVLQNTAKHLQDTMPDHAPNLGMVASSTANYLNSIKPRAPIGLPMDTKVPPSQAQVREYHRQLDIAQQPLMALQHVKDGSLTQQDLITMRNCHPALYQQLQQKMMTALANPDAKQLPYKTKLSMSLFLGQPLDSTMTPQGIMGAQPMATPPTQQANASPSPSKSAGSALNKMSGMYKTPMQAADSRRVHKD